MTNAVALLAGILPLYVVRFSVLGIPTTLFEVAVWATAIVSVCIPRTRRQLRSAAGTIHPKTLILIALFILAAIVSTGISSELRNSLGILKGWVITPLIFGFLVRSAVGKKVEILRSIVISGFVVALFGLSQIQGFNRIHSLYDVPNSFALFLVPVSILAYWIGIRGNNKLYQYAAITMLVAIIATQSLGAIVALVGTLAIGMAFARLLTPSNSPFVRGRERRSIPLLTKEGLGEVSRGMFGSLTIIVIITILLLTLSGRFAYLISPFVHPNTTNSVTVRMQLWDIGISLIKKHPILGIGLGQFEPAYQAELHSRFESDVIPGLPDRQAGLTRNPRSRLQPEYVFRDPHNWVISFWLNLGLLGLVSFIGLNYIAIKRVVSPPFQGGAGGGGSYRQAIALALISILIFGLFDTIYWKNDLSALWWMLILLCTRNKIQGPVIN